ncbi:MAG TPA: glutathione S-transferase N-terminal domain-containing protein [Azospirillaceae bacterium]|nr:glutathione S-transferase N-terminal domain-containing protein [Azospirillaceae bacterium]
MTTLFYSPGACSLAPHIVLEEIGRPFDPVLVMLRQGEHLKPEYLAVNPRARVPALSIEGKVLTENAAILTWLAGTAPEKGLLPADPWERAHAHSLMSFLGSSVHIAFAGLWRAGRFAEDEAAHPAIQATSRTAIEKFFDEVETMLTGRDWAFSTYSVADPYLLVFWRWGTVIGLEMAERFPAWTAHTRRMLARPAVRRALEREGIALEA